MLASADRMAIAAAVAIFNSGLADGDLQSFAQTGCCNREVGRRAVPERRHKVETALQA